MTRRVVRSMVVYVRGSLVSGGGKYVSSGLSSGIAAAVATIPMLVGSYLWLKITSQVSPENRDNTGDD
jgi:hypothetical protein